MGVISGIFEKDYYQSSDKLVLAVAYKGVNAFMHTYMRTWPGSMG